MKTGSNIRWVVMCATVASFICAGVAYLGYHDVKRRLRLKKAIIDLDKRYDDRKVDVASAHSMDASDAPSSWAGKDIPPPMNNE